MKRMRGVPMGLVAWALTLGAAGQQPIIYPAKGQSPQKQNTDTAECQLWAKQTTGVDPVAIAQQGANQPAAPQQQGGMLKGAAGGAALGAMGGAIAGDAAKGAALRAVTGSVVRCGRSGACGWSLATRASGGRGARPRYGTWTRAGIRF